MSEKKKLRKRLILLGIVLCLLLALAVFWGIFTFFPCPLPPDRPMRVIERKTSPLPHREKLLDDANRLHGEGQIDAAVTKLAPEALRIMTVQDRKSAAYNTDLLYDYWRWKLLRNPELVKVQCKDVLKFDPDNLAAKSALGNLLPRSIKELEEQKRFTPEELTELQLLFRELLQCRGLTPDQRSEFSYFLALTDTAIWLNSGYSEREEALRLCRTFPGERRFVQLRHDILYRIWSQQWFFSADFDRIDGRFTSRNQLKKELIRLSRKLR